MKITAIKQQVKNPGRASIFVDGKYSFSLSLDELVAERLRVNAELEGSHLKQLKKLSEDGKLRMRALEWVMLRPHSTKEFRDYLRRKKVEPELTEQLIAEFERKNYLNDETFARWWVERRVRNNKSDRAIRSELASKGVNRETVDVVIGNDGSEAERVKQLVEKLRGRPRYQDEKKLVAYLVRQGYSYSLVADVLRVG